MFNLDYFMFRILILRMFQLILLSSNNLGVIYNYSLILNFIAFLLFLFRFLIYLVFLKLFFLLFLIILFKWCNDLFKNSLAIAFIFSHFDLILKILFLLNWIYAIQIVFMFCNVINIYKDFLVFIYSCQYYDHHIHKAVK